MTIQYSFQYGELESESFPSKIWRTYVADMLDEPQAKLVYGYCDVKGDEQLRREIRRYLYRSRGVCCETEQVILCSGTQAALEMIIRLFPGIHSVAMEGHRLRWELVLIWEGKGVYFYMAITCVMEACLRIC